ncbi:P-loop containing nucleoside triphosphate hydrolase protein [Metschnikowia bicuspidata]|uniref:P-loop containing nucleoside triphosphate hydrolase protein n=1 Tax=Metschnikowia bicuspidata TaxID=27322 RepID=A0A4V1J2R8_9ASCO|nr:P-loop containing nucleoside triphosphate hydrolase protein [Metschnikowia bicuspidata]
MQKSLIVLIGGGHAAGKCTTADLIRKEIKKLPFYSASYLDIEVVNMAKYKLEYDGKTANVDEKTALHRFRPTLFDFEALRSDLEVMVRPQSDRAQKLILVHCLYALYDKSICNLSHMKVYVDSDADTRLIRWIRRDVCVGVGRKLEDVIELYLNGSRQEMADYISPTKKRADVIMPRGAEANGISLIVDGLLPYIGFGKYLEHSQTIQLRPFQNERAKNQTGNYLELNR